MPVRPAGDPAVEPYGGPLDHLADELRRIQLLLDRQVQLLRHRGTLNENPEFQGMFLQESEIDALLETAPGEARHLARVAEIDRELGRLREEIAGRSLATDAELLTLPRLAGAFRLDPFETDACLLGLAPELDLKFHKLYAYVQNDFTKKRPGVNLAVNLLCDSFEGRVAARTHFSADSPLIRYRLLLLDPPPPGQEATMLTREFKLADRVVDFLVGRPNVDDAVADFVRAVQPQATLEDVLLPEELKAHVSALLGQAAGSGEWPLLLLHGPEGTGKKMLAEALCQRLGLPMVLVDLSAIPRERHAFPMIMRRVLREAGLRGAVLHLDGYGSLHNPGEDLHAQRSALHRAVAAFPGPVVLATTTRDVKLGALERETLYRVEVPAPDTTVRDALWRRHLPPAARLADDVDVVELAGKFNLTGGSIRSAIAEAENLLAIRPGADGRLAREDLFAGCRAQLTHQLASYADRIPRHLDWDDLILPEGTMARLKDIPNYFRRRELIFDQWGFDSKLTRGRGISVLFSGPPGTGKTMVAGIIAGELEMDLFKIDLSRVVSKYVGETEKNLARIFDEARESHSIILFDEADSLFSKRTEVKSSIDRYANLEVNFLLQRIETFEGISILTTNFEKSIDEAFKRRLNFRIDFPFPDEKARAGIWKAMLPATAPTADDIDFGWLAERYDLSGGNIKNAVLRGAFLAAERGTSIDHSALEAAAVCEVEEIGKLVRTEG